MDLLTTTLAEAAEAIKSRELSPVELTQATLDRIDLLEPRLNAFITLCGDRAMEAARVAEQEIARGRYRGPMHGIPYGVKDIFSTAGLRTTNGSKVFQDQIPNVTSTAVRNLDAAGGVLVGKNNCAEFASGGDHSSFHGAVHNPWGLEYSPGGSSSGSGASVAAGMLFGSMGTCTGGSIRGPASYCSVVGLKPSYGLVSRYGVFPLSWSIDHAGPMTRTVEDCALMLEAVAGYDPLDPSSARVQVPHYAGALDGNIRGMRIGITRELNEGAGAETGELVQRAFEVLRELGAEVEEVPVPITGDYATVAGNVITWAECAQIHAPWRDRLADYSVGVREKVLVGSVLPQPSTIRPKRCDAPSRRS
jgi:aspartyl-tRNA(Asn)/glutamyl-tRNA(Gln) amidotransferase subunit A